MFKGIIMLTSDLKLTCGWSFKLEDYAKAGAQPYSRFSLEESKQGGRSLTHHVLIIDE